MVNFRKIILAVFKTVGIFVGMETPKRGRKPKPDGEKRKQRNIWVSDDAVKAAGGWDKARKIAEEAIENYPKNISNGL